MVQRTSERLNLDAGRSPEVAVQGGGRVGPRNTGGIFDNQIATKYPDLTAVPSGQLDPVSAALFNVGTQVTDKLIERQKQEAYLNGALAVGAGLAEDQVESNIFTRQWAKAGYRDTVGRLALADYEASIAKDMEKLRERTPEEMARYLQQRRKGLAPVLDAMSAETRAQVFGQLITSERASIAAHTKAHSEFIVGAQSKSLQAGASAVISKMRMTGGPADPTYGPARDAAAYWLYANIWENPNLDQKSKEKLYEEALGSSMAQGDVGLYDFIQNAPLEDGTTLWDRMSLGTQQKLANQYYTTMGKHTARISADWWTKQNAIAVGMETGEVPSLDQAYAHVQQGIQLQTMSPEAGVSFMARVARKTGEKNEEAQLTQFALTGNIAGIVRAGGTAEKAAKATASVLLQQKPPGEVVVQLMDAATNGGLAELGQEATKLIQPSLTVLMQAGGDKAEKYPTADSNVEMLGAWFQRYNSDSMRGDRLAQHSMLKGLPEEQRVWVLTYEQVKRESGNSMNDLDAVNRTREIILKGGGDPITHASNVSKLTTQKRATLDGFYEQGALTRAGTWFGSMFSAQSKARHELGEYMGWWSNDVIKQENRATTVNAIELEYDRLSLTHPGWDAEMVKDMAVTNVYNRTVNTDYGIILHPPGTDLRTAYGAPDIADPELLGKAVSKVMADRGFKPGSGVSFSYDGTNLRYRNIDPDTGLPTGGDYIDAKEVGRVAEDIVKQQDSDYSVAYAGGKARVDPVSNASVRYNGQNTAGVDPKVAVKLRDILIDHEGIRDKPYEDTKGNVTVGVGLQNKDWYPKKNEFRPDGTLKPSAMDARFHAASNAAMRGATKAIAAVGFAPNDENLLGLFTSMGYQGGMEFYKNSTYSKFLGELKAGTVETAVEAFKALPVYTSSGKSRQEWYLQRVQDHFKK